MSSDMYGKEHSKDDLLNTIKGTSLKVKEEAEKDGNKEWNNYIDTEDEDEEEDDLDDEDVRVRTQHLYNGYDPSDYEQLVVPKEIKELFQYITKYSSQVIELEHKLQPFIPEFVPAVGDIDAFIKVQHPIEKSHNEGLLVLDEPCMIQSDPAVLKLKLKTISKESYTGATIVKKIKDPQKHPKTIYKWIKDLNNIRKNKHSSMFHYSKPMPDIDTLLQEWSPESEDSISELGINIAEIDINLSTKVDVICSLLDIPRYEGTSRIEALHLLFTLYLVIKNSQFKQVFPST